MRVPSGDAVHRAYAIQAGGDGGELVVVEIENRSPLPFVAAIAVRPYNPEGLAVVERIGLVDRTVTVDGRPAVLFPKAPARMAASTFHDGDSAVAVIDGRAGTTFPKRLKCEAGLAQAAFLFPVAHRATLRVALPIVPVRRTRRRGLARRRVERLPELPETLPRRRGRRGLGGPDPPGPAPRAARRPAEEAVEANRRYLLLLHDGDRHHPGPGHLSPVLVPRRRLPAGRPRPLRLPPRGERGAALLSGSSARRRLLLQPAPGMGRQRRRPLDAGRALATDA